MSYQRIKYVPVDDNIYSNRIKYDSIYLKDSIYMSVKGDTVYIYEYQYQYRDKLIRDTVNVTRCDSMLHPIEV